MRFIGDMLLEKLTCMKRHEAPNRKDRALLTNFRKRYEEEEEADLEVEKESLLAKIVEWELMLLDNREGFAN